MQYQNPYRIIHYNTPSPKAIAQPRYLLCTPWMLRTSMTMGLLETFFMSVRNSEEMDMKREVSTGSRVLMSAEPLQGEELKKLIKRLNLKFRTNRPDIARNSYM